jgi:hypothetical protein
VSVPAKAEAEPAISVVEDGFVFSASVIIGRFFFLVVVLFFLLCE